MTDADPPVDGATEPGVPGDAVECARQLAIDLDPLAVRIARAVTEGDEGGMRMDMIEAGEVSVPPSVVLPRYGGEPVQVDLAWPVHPRATGDHWPPESRVRFGPEEPGPSRMPMAYAWPMLADGIAWTWEPAPDEARGRRRRTITAAEAIAQILAAALETAMDSDTECGETGTGRRARGAATLPAAIRVREPLLVVPGALPSPARRALGNAAQRLRMHPRFISRTEAAALAWAGLLPRRAGRRAEVVTLHLGLDEWELGVAEVTRSTEAGGAVPAVTVNHALHTSLLSPGLEMVHRVAEQAAQMSLRQGGASRAWELLWCTPWLSATFSMMVEGSAAGLPPQLGFLSPHVRKVEFLRQQCRAAMQRAPGVGPDVGSLLRQFRPRDGGFPAAREWIMAARRSFRQNGVEPAGAVVTGALAAIPWDDHRSFAAHHLQQLGIDPHGVIIETADVPPGLLARGASMSGGATDAGDAHHGGAC